MPFVNASNNVREWIFKSSVPFSLACVKLEVVRELNDLDRIYLKYIGFFSKMRTCNQHHAI